MGDSGEDYQSQLLALMRRLSKVDGQTCSAETSWLKALESEFGLEKAPDAEFHPDTLRRVIQGAGEAEELVELLLTVSIADREISANEWRLILEVASIVGLEKEEVERLRDEIVASTQS